MLENQMKSAKVVKNMQVCASVFIVLSEPLTLRFAMEDRGRIYKEWNNENPSDSFIEHEPYIPPMENDDLLNK